MTSIGVIVETPDTPQPLDNWQKECVFHAGDQTGNIALLLFQDGS